MNFAARHIGRKVDLRSALKLWLNGRLHTGS